MRFFIYDKMFRGLYGNMRKIKVTDRYRNLISPHFGSPRDDCHTELIKEQL